MIVPPLTFTLWVAGKLPTLTVPETGWVAGRLPTFTVPATGTGLDDVFITRTFVI